jgi:hypothetical protein
MQWFHPVSIIATPAPSKRIATEGDTNMHDTQNKQWIPANQAWIQFAKDHPEFGVRPTENSWIHFQRTHAQALVAVDVIRRIAYRGRMLADTSRFESATFNLLTTGNVEGRVEPKQARAA